MKLLFPKFLNITLTRATIPPPDKGGINDGSWILQYTEQFDMEPNLLKEALDATAKVMEKLKLKPDVSLKDGTISYAYTGRLSECINIIVGEFYTLSSLGDITLRELYTLAGLAIASGWLERTRGGDT